MVVLGTLTLPGVRRSVGFARRFLRDLLPPGHPAPDDLVTVGSETVCNAITHTASGKGGRVTVSLLGGGDYYYLLEVADGGAGGGRPRVKGRPGPRAGAGSGSWRPWRRRGDSGRTATARVGAVRLAVRNLAGKHRQGLSECSRRLVPAAFEGGDP